MRLPALRIASLLAVCVLAGSRLGWSQESRPWRMTGAWIAVGPNAPFLTRLGTRHHDLYVLALRAERVLMRRGAMELYHTVDVVPLAASTATPVRYDDQACSAIARTGREGRCARPVPQMGTVYGFGLVPTGLEVRYPAHKAIQVLGGAAVGVLFFTRPMPDPLAARLNFSIGGDVGLRISAGGGRAIDLRYRFQHVSNGGTGRVNPGLNAHMLRVGVTVRGT